VVGVNPLVAAVAMRSGLPTQKVEEQAPYLFDNPRLFLDPAGLFLLFEAMGLDHATFDAQVCLPGGLAGPWLLQLVGMIEAHYLRLIRKAITPGELFTIKQAVTTMARNYTRVPVPAAPLPHHDQVRLCATVMVDNSAAMKDFTDALRPYEEARIELGSDQGGDRSLILFPQYWPLSAELVRTMCVRQLERQPLVAQSPKREREEGGDPKGKLKGCRRCGAQVPLGPDSFKRHNKVCPKKGRAEKPAKAAATSP
jgi:hypothetical protein